MAKTLTISPANPIWFRIETGGGTINTGLYLYQNYLYDDIQAFYNCAGLMPVENIEACIDCSDTLVFQVYYDDDATGDDIYARISDVNGVVAIMTQTAPFSDTEYKLFTLDLTGLACGECYFVEVLTTVADAGVTVDWGDSGTFENLVTWADFWSSGSGLNIRAQSNTYAQAGTYSAKITAPGAPTATSGQLVRTDNQQAVTAWTVYEISGYIYIDSGAVNIGSAADRIEWDVLSSSPDVAILSNTYYTVGTDPEDAWFEVKLLFVASTDILIQYQLRLSDGSAAVAPTANGIVYTDTHKIDLYADTTEATSETFKLQDGCACTSKVQYTGTEFQFGMMFDGVAAFTPQIRVKLNRGRFQMNSDPDTFTNKRNTLGQWTAIASAPQPVHEVITDMMQPWQCRLLALATLFESVLIDGVKYTRNNGNFEIDWTDKGEGGICTFEIVPDFAPRKGVCL